MRFRPALLIIALVASRLPAAGQPLPTSGELQALVVFVRFQDDEVSGQGCLTRAEREWSDLEALPAVADHLLSPSPEPPFADSSLTAYFFEQSNARFVLYGRSYPRLIVTERAERAYASGSSAALDRAALNREILRRMRTDPDFEVADFDRDGDGKIDYLFVVLRRMNDLQLVPGGAPGLAALGGSGPATHAPGEQPGPGVGPGSYIVYGSSGIIIPQLDLVRLMAHELGHDLWRRSPLAGGHIPYIGGENGVPGNGSRRLGYALMVGRLSTYPQRDVTDTRGDWTISAFERDMLEDGWIDCAALSESGPVTLGDLYTTSDCRTLALLRGGTARKLYLTNRQRIGFFDRLQFNPCQSSYHGLMTTGLLVQVLEDRRLGVPAADNSLDLSIDTTAYTGDMFGAVSATQLTPWTRPNISGFSTYPPGFTMAAENWQALDDIQGAGTFEYVRDVRLRPIIREDSWIGAETSGTIFRHDLIVTGGARLTIEAGTTIGLADGAWLVVDAGSSLVVEPGARIELRPGSVVRARGTVVAPEDGAIVDVPAAE